MTFLNVTEIESALVALNATYPYLTELVSLPFHTAQVRWSHALVIRGNHSYRCGRPGVVFISGAHAREWGGPDILVNLATDLLEAYTTNSGLTYGGKSFTAAEVTSIVNGIDLVIFPDINPDGRAWSMAGAPGSAQAMWRKNRNPASGGGSTGNAGVDPNRNYDFLWNFPQSFSPSANMSTLASTDPGSDLFHGTGPFSEAETQNVLWLVDKFPNVRWFVDVHSYGGDILYSWGDDENQTFDSSKSFLNAAWDHQRGVAGDAYREYLPPQYLSEITTAANVIRDGINAVRGQGYVSAQAFNLPGWPSYPTSGASDDWAFSRGFAGSGGQVNSFVIEFNPTWNFFPTWAEMVDMIGDVDGGLLALCLHARPSPLFVLFCWIREHLYILWHRVFPPELWGPYGPWTRIVAIADRVASVIVNVIRGIAQRGP